MFFRILYLYLRDVHRIIWGQGSNLKIRAQSYTKFFWETFSWNTKFRNMIRTNYLHLFQLLVSSWKWTDLATYLTHPSKKWIFTQKKFLHFPKKINLKTKNILIPVRKSQSPSPHTYNPFYNILRIFNVLTSFPFTTSETMRNYYS